MRKDEKILFKNLSKYNIQKLVICSLEQALYQVLVVIDGTERLVWDNKDRCLRSRNLMELRESLEHLNIPESVLRHESPYDEMVGMAEKTHSNRLEVPLGKNPYSVPKWLN